MTNVTLIVIPGPGARSIQIQDNATVSNLVCQENLHGRDIIINGQGVPPNSWETTVVPANAEVFATGSVKGNNSQATLVVIPGPGARTVELDPEMTVADLACREICMAKRTLSLMARVSQQTLGILLLYLLTARSSLPAL